MDYQDYYLRQAGGNNIGVFSGSPRQRGHGLGGVFRSLYRYMVPLFKTHALPAFKSGAKSIGKEALRAATNVGIDALRGDDFKQSVKNNFETAITNLHEKAKDKLQTGGGSKRRWSLKKNKKKGYKIKKKRDLHFKLNNKKSTRTIEDIFS
jgi:hypothetical protein